MTKNAYPLNPIDTEADYRAALQRVAPYFENEPEIGSDAGKHFVWTLQIGLEIPAERLIRQIIDESWTEHLRRVDRVTAADVALRDRKLASHVAGEPPRVTRRVIER